MNYNDLQRIRLYVCGSSGLKSLEQLTGYNGFDYITVPAPDPLPFSDEPQPNHQHYTPPPPPPPPNPQTNCQSASGHQPTHSTSNSASAGLPGIASFDKSKQQSPLTGGMAVTLARPGDAKSTVGYLNV